MFFVESEYSAYRRDSVIIGARMAMQELRDTFPSAMHQCGILANIMQGAPIAITLDAICRYIEDTLPGLRSSVALLDPQRQTLSVAAAPRLPEAYLAVLQEVPVSDKIGTCPRAAFANHAVFTDDIANDPCWREWHAIAEQHALRSCWSLPLQDGGGCVLGILGLLSDTPRTMSTSEHELVKCIQLLAAMAIDRDQLAASEDNYRAFFHNNPDAVFSADQHGLILEVNPAALSITGFNQDDLIGRHLLDFVDPEQHSNLKASFSRAMRGETASFEIHYIDAYGESRYASSTFVPVHFRGEVSGVYGISKDITERRHHQARMRVLERSVESSINGVVIVDAQAPDMPINYVNEAFLSLTGYAKHEVMGRNCRFLQGPETNPETVAIMRQRLHARREIQVTIQNLRKDGSAFWNDLRISPVVDEKNQLTHFIGVQQDVTQQKLYKDQLAFYATHDALTWLPTRSLLEQRLNHWHRRTTERGNTLAVLYVDLDHFKPVNDTMGHDVGDALLVEMAGRLQDQLRPIDTLSRFGGDEFLVVLPELSCHEDASRVAHRLMKVASNPFHIEGNELALSLSIGIATSSSAEDSPLELITQSDMAMLDAKKFGRNTCYWFDGQVPGTQTGSVAIRRDLQAALRDDHFQLAYQPLVKADGALCGFEALLRWEHPERGSISPANFIPLAETTGQIVPISDWVIRQAVHDITELNAHGLADERIAVNLSALQFHRGDFLSSLQATLDEYGVSNDRLEVELTEGILMERSPAAIDTLTQLKSSGVRIAIDDFGTGYSSLCYLKSLPVSTIKIDKSFVTDISSSPADAAIVTGVITMAHQLGFEVLAEGIETGEQFAFLRDNSCDMFQGYWFARPMPLADAIAFAKRYKRTAIPRERDTKTRQPTTA